MGIESNTLYGTLNLLVLQALRDGPLHGLGVARRIDQSSQGALKVEEGALYPALRRLEKRGYLASEWGRTETGREAKFYELTDAGEAELAEGVDVWHRYVAAMARVLG